MSSTSSSECECDEYYSYEASLYNQGNYGRTPFYPTMGQPLIYYAQIPQPSKRQRSRENKKNNQNCFAKAFKWYTEEHVPYNSGTYYNTDMNGFAAWLDSKYNEFLQDNQLNSVCRIQMKQTSVEAERVPISTCCESRTKRFRVKSPWRRKRPTSSKEAGDVIHKPNQSFQFILQPKNLTRPASECCRASNGSIISTEIPIRSSIKSQSYTILSQQENMTELSYVRSALDENKPGKNADKQKSGGKLDVKSVKSVNGTESQNLQNISCQCSVPKVVKINVQTQYEDSGSQRAISANDNQITSKTTLCQPCQNLLPFNIVYPKSSVSSAVKEVQVKSATLKNPITCQCSEERIPKADAHINYQKQTVFVERPSSISNIQSSSKMNKTCPCESNMDEFKVDYLTNFSSPIAFSHDGVQTSDHSIRIEKDDAHEYPLFMKIVCADRLSK